MPANPESVNNFSQFRDSVLQTFNNLRGEDGAVSLDKYLHSQEYQDYPPAEALLRARRQRLESIRETQEELAALNKIRSLHKLLPIPDPFAQEGIRRQMSGHPQTIKPPGFQQDTGEAAGIDRSFISDRVIGDIPLAARVLSLIHPDSIPGLSVRGRDRRRQMIMAESSTGDRLRIGLEEGLTQALRRQVSPDFSLASGEWMKIRGYLISHINPQFSAVSTADYDVLPALPFGQQDNRARLRFNKPIYSGLNTLLCPPGYRPVGYFHPTESIEMFISGIPERNVYAFTSNWDIPDGLVFYFAKSNLVDNSSPDEKERAQIAYLDQLPGYWRNLIEQVRVSPLTDKQKADILLQAWTNSFNYDDSQETFDLYQSSRPMPRTFASQVIREASGNCGYSSRGFHGLLSLVGIPSREVASFLSDGFGNYTLRGNYHGLNQAYLDGKWVYIESQVGYLQPGYEMEDIPVEWREQFNQLLQAIPKKQSQSAKQLESLPPILPDILPPRLTIREAASELVGLEGKIRFVRTGGLLAATASLGILMAEKMVEYLSNKLPQIRLPVPDLSRSTESPPDLPSPPDLSPIDLTTMIDTIHSIPPEMLVIALLLGASFYGGRLYERRLKNNSTTDINGADSDEDESS